uniref:uncharacterized protein LOC122583624 n=1 Tax=Erigeron canadensis TaxID=72917 RepID=UPI001CB8C4CE|nr:uncharacterized protein LOC122583624 [Erigeron canadensis]
MDSDDSSGSSFGSSNGHDDYADRFQAILQRAAQVVQRRLADQPDTVIHRRVPVDRNRIEAHARLMHDYFNDQPRYNVRLFRKRFRMTKPLFMRIVGDLEARYPYFQTRYDRAGRKGFAGVQKCTSAIRQLAYGVNSDFLDYMIGSIDCMHWPWELCPATWRATYTGGHVGRPSLILQAVASNDLWIWNAYFGRQGSHNDINVFEASSILEEIINGLAPSVPFSAYGNHYEKGYYLGDDIYPEYATFVKTFSDSIDEKRRLFKKKQESARKGIERAFDEGKAVCQDYNAQEPSLNPAYWSQQTPMEVRIQNLRTVKNRETHNMLTADLVDHIWANTPHDFEPPADPFADLRDYVSTDDDDSD